jgi:hypothetical protein
VKLSTETAWGENPALSYRNMRAIIGYVGLSLPVVLLLAGAVDGHIESSISAYYYTKVGNVFTGALCVIGIFLLAYRLTAWAIDNVVTTLAGLSALGVAFFHAAPSNATLTQLRLADVHLTCAAALFILLGAISLFIFPRDVLPDQRWRSNWYMAFGALIWLSIILMPVLNWLGGSFYDDNHVFFILETVCVMAFAVSFILKGHGQPGSPGLDQTAGQLLPAATRPPVGADTVPTGVRHPGLPSGPRDPDRDLDPEHRVARPGIDVDGSAVTFCDDTAGDVQAEAGVLGRVLGREEGLERPGRHLR